MKVMGKDSCKILEQRVIELNDELFLLRYKV
jgi:hypothetical protein